MKESKIKEDQSKAKVVATQKFITFNFALQRKCSRMQRVQRVEKV
jgi:hypothetical protein